MRRPSTPARFVMCAALAASVGCHRRGAVPGDVPTWSHDIAPLLERRCGACHGDGRSPAVAPPALGGYREARQAAPNALRAIRRRMMPPFGADDTGLCGTWTDAAWLTDDEIATFGAWVEHGMPHGFGPPARAAADVPAAPALAALGPGVMFTPGLGERASRCFLVAAPARPTELLLTGLSVTSEPRAAVRQANVYALSEAEVARARALDAADDGPGWACQGAVEGVNTAELVGSWSRNTPWQRSPDGTGVPLRAPAYLAQVRYDLIASGPGIPVNARFSLGTAASEPDRAARLMALRPAPFTLPANQSQVRVNATWTVDHPTTLRGLVPRMNALGRTMDLQVVHATERR
ncbi:MAG TPA: hypothetical protein VH328_15340, partial [Burkholderiaceae bacterium]|nr:hypothetical protein [Burkholderiaceae bacterium]